MCVCRTTTKDPSWGRFIQLSIIAHKKKHWAAFRATLENLIPVLEIPSGWELYYFGYHCSSSPGDVRVSESFLRLEDFGAAHVPPQGSGCGSILISVCNKAVRI